MNAPTLTTKARALQPTSAAAFEASPRMRWLLGLVLFAAVVFAYQPAWDAGFIWDDDHYVTHNPLLTAPDGLKRIWFSTDSPSQYFPLVYTTFRIEHSLWGLNASGYHWVNILLHGVNALLVWRLLRRLAIPGAWLGAAIFALHPLQVESVAWITELKNVQSLFFFLLALLAWVEFLADRPQWRWYATALACYALALFSKTTACTLPAALVLVLWWQNRRIDARRWLQIVPFVAMGIAMGLVSIWWERHHQGTVGDSYSLAWMERFLVAGRAVWFYLGKLVWPANLTFNYPLWTINAAAPSHYFWLLLCGAAAAVVYFARRAWGRGPEVALVFFVAMMSPLLGFVMMYTFKYTFVADHYVYVALIGPAALAGAVLTKLGARLRVAWLAPVGASALVLALAAMSWRQSRMYEDLETLWRVTIARNPSSYMAHNNLGAIHLGRGEIDQAIMHFERALEILPRHGNAYGNLGHALLEQGRVAEARQRFAQAVEVEPNSAKSHSDFAFVLLRAGEADQALVHAQRAVALEPKAPEAHNVLSIVQLERQQFAEAAEHAREALRFHASYPEAHQNLAAALNGLGQFDEALVHHDRALQLQPALLEARLGMAQGLLNMGRAADAAGLLEQADPTQRALPALRTMLGVALLNVGRPDLAATELRQAVAADPQRSDAQLNLAIALFQMGQADEGLATFKVLADAQPANIDAQFNYGFALLQLGRTDEAIARFEAVVKLQPALGMAHSNLARALLQKGRATDAIARYQEFLRLEPDHPHAMSDLAWVLATWPAESIRDGARALALAQKAAALTGGEDPMVLRALAASLAENKRFADAAATVRRAAERAEAQGNAPLAEVLRGHLTSYEAGAPVRESIQAP